MENLNAIHIPLASDLNKFIALYNSIGITPIINYLDDNTIIIELSEGKSKKIGGFRNHSTSIYFDGNGNFIEQCFWS